ncbi:MAG: secretin and TonB N-terminal domain-containing protein, partial [Dinghuibacter sp.]|nr:secretin and TonB N-terminal domain-containing protein [Dinghuibacter sp.]
MTKKFMNAGTSTAFKKILLSMKLTLLLTICCAFHAWAGSDAQTVSLKTNDKEIIKVLADIEDQGSYRFLFNTRLKELKQKVSINVENMPLATVLQQVFSGTSLTFRVLDNNLIAIRSNDPAEAQDIRITGRITNENGDGLAAVSIAIKGTSLGTSSDASGNFALNAPENAT